MTLQCWHESELSKEVWYVYNIGHIISKTEPWSKLVKRYRNVTPFSLQNFAQCQAWQKWLKLQYWDTFLIHHILIILWEKYRVSYIFWKLNVRRIWKLQRLVQIRKNYRHFLVLFTTNGSKKGLSLGLNISKLNRMTCNFRLVIFKRMVRAFKWCV